MQRDGINESRNVFSPPFKVPLSRQEAAGRADSAPIIPVELLHISDGNPNEINCVTNLLVPKSENMSVEEARQAVEDAFASTLVQ